MNAAVFWVLMAIVILLVLILLVALLKEYMQGGKYSKATTAEGKVVIVTGANTGIGKETVKELAKRGATIYMACRSMQRAQAARDEVVAATNSKKVYCRELDLCSLQSVRHFAAKFKEEQSRLDLLINNAGVMAVRPRGTTKDGFEMQLGVNHLGHFLLTNLLLDLIKSSAPSRIVNVSSLAHERGAIHVNDLNFEKSYDAFTAYSQSKLANILFTKELAVRLQGTSVTVNALHPGVVETELTRSMGPTIDKIAKIGYKTVFWPFVKTAANGAQTTIYAALDPDLDKVTGMYFSDCKLKKTSKAARDDEMATWLWTKSESLTGLKAKN